MIWTQKRTLGMVRTQCFEIMNKHVLIDYFITRVSWFMSNLSCILWYKMAFCKISTFSDPLQCFYLFTSLGKVDWNGNLEFNVNESQSWFILYIKLKLLTREHEFMIFANDKVLVVYLNIFPSYLYRRWMLDAFQYDRYTKEQPRLLHILTQFSVSVLWRIWG